MDLNPSRKCHGALISALALISTLVVVSLPARAGVALSHSQEFVGSYSYTGTGASLISTRHSGTFCPVNSSATASLSGIPTGASVVSARLYWAGSYRDSAGFPPDTSVQFGPTGLPATEVTAPAMTDSYDTGYYVIDFWGSAADVTSIVTGNGSYTLSGLTVYNGEPHCSQTQTVMGGWTLLVVYEDPSLQTNTVQIYEGFVGATGSLGTFTLDGFRVPSVGGTGSSMAFVGWEGDPTGGSGEAISLNGIALSNATNPANNPFNSTVDIAGLSPVYGVDFDRFDVGTVLAAGDTSASLQVNSGSSELVMLSTVALEIPTEYLNLSVEKTANRSVVGIGDTVTYTVTLVNEGPDTATNVVVTDALPGGLSLVSAVPSAGSFSGDEWSIPSLDAGTATLTLTATVVSAGTHVNTASITSVDQAQTAGSDDSDSASIWAASIAVSKTANVSGSVTAGDEIEFTVEVENTSGAPVSDVVVSDQLPTGLTYVSGSTTASGGTALSAANDDFSSGTFTGGTGWSGPWVEINEISGGSGPSSGNITVIAGGARMRRSDASEPYPAVQRGVDLSGHVSATVSFDLIIPRANDSSRDTLTVYFSPDGVSRQQLGVYRDEYDAGSYSFSETGPFTSAAYVEFAVTSGTQQNGEYYQIDNVTVGGTQTHPTLDNNPSTPEGELADGNPPNLVTAADGFDLQPGETLTVTYRAIVDPLDGSFVDLVNTAQAHHSGDSTPVGASTSIDVLFEPVLTASKTADVSSQAVGGTVNYTVEVSHDPTSDGSPAANVNVNDPLTTLTYAGGDTDADMLLDFGETWTYTGDYVVTVADPDPLVNTVSVDGETVDGDALDTVTASVSVDVLNPPVANDDSALVLEDGSVWVDVLGNDTDSDGDSLSVVGVSQGSYGSVTFTPSGVTYTPDPDFNGTDTFTYTISDGNGGTDTATVTVTVTPVNDAPAAVDDSAGVVEDGSIVVDVLANDSDTDGDSLEVTGVTQGSDGVVSFTASGVTYTPDPDFNGTDTFTYTVSDGNGGFDTATVTVTVHEGNDTPIAVDDSASVLEDGSVLVDVLANDTDVDGDSLEVTGVTQPANGSVSFTASGVTYTPDPDFNGTDTFTYTVSDGNGGFDTATVTVTVVAVNDAPVAVDDSAGVVEDGSVVVDVLANDSDPDGDSLEVSGVTQPASGSVSFTASGVTYTPDPDFDGTDTFTYTVSDGNGGFDTATVTVTVVAVNDAPVAVDDSVGVVEDGSVVVDVLANDSDPDGDSLEVTGVTQGSDGLVSFTASGVTYTPDPDFNGTDTFTYTISDGNGGFDTATVTVTVAAVNDVPVAVDDAASVAEDGSVLVDVLANDSDPDGDSLEVTGVTQPANGSVSFTASGVTYTPDPDFNGTDTFTYTISDGNGGSDTATVTVTVTPQNDAPVAVDDAASVAEDGSVLVDVLANDTDVDGDALAVVSVSQGSNGGVVFTASGVTYTPDPDFDGTDTFTYTISDGNGGTDSATVTVTVTPVNDAPVAVDDAASVAEDGSVLVDVLANDTDVDGDSLEVTGVTQGSDGVVSFTAIGVTYTPDPDFNGSDSFTYTISDGNGGFDTATVTVTVAAVNDAPVAVDDSASVAEDGSAAIDVLANDFDPDVDTLAVVSVSQGMNGTVTYTATGVTYAPDSDFTGTDTFTYTISDGNGGTDTATVTVAVSNGNDAPVAVDDSASVAEDGSAAIDVLANDTDVDGDSLEVTGVTQGSDGGVVFTASGVTYTPDPDFTGTDTFTYTISDGNGGFDTATVTVTVTPVNDAPVANDDTALVAEDGSAGIDVLANDTDVDGDSLEVISVTQPANGSVSFTASGVTYTPDPDFGGTDTFTYAVSDGNGGFDLARVTVTVVPVNDAPVAIDDTALVAEDGSAGIGVLANDTDVDGDSLEVTGVTQGSDGSVSFTASGVTYTPDTDFNGTDTFTYTISDGNGGSDTATVTVTVTPQNDAPVAVDDSAGVVEDGSVVVDVLVNDSDPDGDSLEVTGVTQGSDGSVSFTASGVTYAPDPDFNGTDTFTYTISDGNGGTDTATVTVTVAAVNDAPVAVDDSASVAEDGSAAIDVLANDTDVDGDSLEVTGVTQPASGSVSFTASGVTYTPDPNFNGTDAFTYTVSDGNGGFDTATVTVTVTPQNDAPVAIDDTASVAEDGSAAIDVLANDTDLDGDSLEVVSVSQGLNGTVTYTATGVTYTPDPDFNGTDTFTYTISDSNGGTDTATVTVTVIPWNDSPVAVDDSVSIAEDITSWIDVLANDTDLDGDSLEVIAVTQPSSGSVVIAVSGVSYTPDTDFNGTDTFTYTVSDGNGGTDTATVTVTVTPVNDAPIANDDTASVAEDGSAAIDVLANDTDVDGDSLEVISVTQPAHGSVTFTGSGVTYIPNSDFNGSDSFTYTVVDGNGGSSTATVDVNVTPVNDDPVPVDDSVATGFATPVTVDALANDTDVDGDALTILSVTDGANGTAVVNGDGEILYTPDFGFSGTDTVTYTVSDGNGGIATAEVVVLVGVGSVVSGQVWLDGDGDGVIDDGEVDIAGVEITLIWSGLDGILGTVDDVTFPTVVTASPFVFTAVPAGLSSVSVNTATLPAPMNATFDVDGGGDSISLITIPENANVSGIHFGYRYMNQPPDYAAGFDPLLVTVTGSPLPPIDLFDPDGDDVTVTLISGTLPEGLSLNPDGSFSGSTEVSGVFALQVQLCDDGVPEMCVIRDLSVEIIFVPVTLPGPGSTTTTTTIPPVIGPGTLPYTGFDSTKFMLVGVVLMVSGLTLLLVARKRDDSEALVEED